MQISFGKQKFVSPKDIVLKVVWKKKSENIVFYGNLNIE